MCSKFKRPNSPCMSQPLFALDARYPSINVCDPRPANTAPNYISQTFKQSPELIFSWFSSTSPFIHCPTQLSIIMAFPPAAQSSNQKVEVMGRAPAKIQRPTQKTIFRVQCRASFTMWAPTVGFEAQAHYGFKYSQWVTADMFHRHLNWEDKLPPFSPFISVYDNYSKSWCRPRMPPDLSVTVNRQLMGKNRGRPETGRVLDRQQRTSGADCQDFHRRLHANVLGHREARWLHHAPPSLAGREASHHIHHHGRHQALLGRRKQS